LINTQGRTSSHISLIINTANHPHSITFVKKKNMTGADTIGFIVSAFFLVTLLAAGPLVVMTSIYD
jgi:hypothetical protein